MATVAWAELQPAKAPAAGVGGFAEAYSPGVKIFKWTGLTAADDGAWLPIGPFTEASMQILLEGGGSFGDSTVALQGSNEYGTPTAGKNTVVQDGNGNDITGKAAEGSGEQFMTMFQQLRPKLTGTTGTGISVLLRLTTSRAGRQG